MDNKYNTPNKDKEYNKNVALFYGVTPNMTPSSSAFSIIISLFYLLFLSRQKYTTNNPNFNVYTSNSPQK